MEEALPQTEANKGGLASALVRQGRPRAGPGSVGAYVMTLQERKLLAAAQQMLRDSQLKVALLRMKISSLEASGAREPGEAWKGGAGRGWAGLGRAEGGVGLRADPLLPGPELLAEELRHRLRIEAAVAEGAKNVVKLLGGRRTHDRKALAEVRSGCPHFVTTPLCGSACPHATLCTVVGLSGAAVRKPDTRSLWPSLWAGGLSPWAWPPRSWACPPCLFLLRRLRPSSRSPPRSWTSCGWPWNSCSRDFLPLILCVAEWRGSYGPLCLGSPSPRGCL